MMIRAADKGLGDRIPAFFQRGIRNTADPNYFTAFLLFRYKLNHLQNFAECLTCRIKHAYSHHNCASLHRKHVVLSITNSLVQNISETNE